MHNNTELDCFDNAYRDKSKPIDSIIVTPNIMEHIRGYKLLEVNKVVIIDYRLCLININFEIYFKVIISPQDNINKVILDTLYRSYRKKFCIILDKIID